jgi:PAS domain S-box-containing protein
VSSRPSRGAARLASILDALPDALLLVDVNGTVVNANSIALETFESPGTALVGRGLLDLIPSFDPKRIPGSMRTRDPEEGPRTKPTRMVARRTDGTEFPVEVTSANLEDGRTPYADHGDPLPHFTGDELLMLVVRDLTGTLDTEAELARQQRQTEMILRAAAEGVVGVDTEGKVVLVNPSAAQILGYRATDLGGKELHPLVQHSRADGSALAYEETPLADTLRSGRKHRVRGQVLWRKDGRQVPVDLTTAPVRDGDQLVGAVMTFTDRTAFDAQAARTAQLDALLDGSLRAPLAELRAELTGLAADPAGQLWPEANQILHHLSAGYSRITTLIDNVLAYQRLDRGEEKLRREDVGLDQVIAAAIEGATELIGPGRAQFAVHAPPIEAAVDGERMAQALAHLVADVAGIDASGNALAFTGDSTIVVAAALRGDVIRIDVRGPHPGGDPVHLPLARGIVERHGGVLQTHQVPGGSAYVLEVPAGKGGSGGSGTGTGTRAAGGTATGAGTDAGAALPSGEGRHGAAAEGGDGAPRESDTTVMPVPVEPARGTLGPGGAPGGRPEEAAAWTAQPQAQGRQQAQADVAGRPQAQPQDAPAPTGRRRALRRPEGRPEPAEAPAADPQAQPQPQPTGRRRARPDTQPHPQDAAAAGANGTAPAPPAPAPASPDRAELPPAPIPNALPAAGDTPAPAHQRQHAAGGSRTAAFLDEPGPQNEGFARAGRHGAGPQPGAFPQGPGHQGEPHAAAPHGPAPQEQAPHADPEGHAAHAQHGAPFPQAPDAPGGPHPEGHAAQHSAAPQQGAASPQAPDTPSGPHPETHAAQHGAAPNQGAPFPQAPQAPSAPQNGTRRSHRAPDAAHAQPQQQPQAQPQVQAPAQAQPASQPQPQPPAPAPVPPQPQPPLPAAPQSWPDAGLVVPSSPNAWPSANAAGTGPVPGAPEAQPAPPAQPRHQQPQPQQPHQAPELPQAQPRPELPQGQNADAAPSAGPAAAEAPTPAPPTDWPAPQTARTPLASPPPQAPGPAGPPRDPSHSTYGRAISVRTLGQGVFAHHPGGDPQTQTQAVEAQNPQGLPAQVAAGGSGRRRRLSPDRAADDAPSTRSLIERVPSQPQAPAAEPPRPHPQADPDSGQLPMPPRPQQQPPAASPEEETTLLRPVPAQSTPDAQDASAPGRSYAIGAPAAGAAEGPEPLDGPNGAVDVTDMAAEAGAADDDRIEEPLDEPRRLLVWPEPDVSTRQALTDRGYRPVIVRSREEVDAQVAEPPAALFVDPLTGPITRTALQALRQAAAAADVPVLVTAGLGQATREAAYGADPAVLLKALAPRDSEQHPPRVLLVESHEPIAQAFAATLERRGMQVAHAGSEAEAMTAAAQMHPNLVVMDLMLIRRRRQGIVDWLRGHSRLNATPLVVYTSADIDPAELPRLASGETVLFLAERSTSPDVQSRIVDLLGKIGV